MKSTAERRLSFILAFLFSLAAILSLSACGNKEQVQAAGAAARPPAPVVVTSVEQRDIPIQINAIGNVEAYQIVQIRSQVNGQIQKIIFKEGDDVRRDQLLFQLDKRPFQADLDRAMGQLKRDQAQAVLTRLEDPSGFHLVPAIFPAFIHAGLGETSAAINHIEQAFEEHDAFVLWLGVSPDWDVLRCEPRFQNLLLRLDLPARLAT